MSSGCVFCELHSAEYNIGQKEVLILWFCGMKCKHGRHLLQEGR